MTSPTTNSTDRPDGKSPLSGPNIVPEFEAALTRLCAVARQGQRADSPLYNPSEAWIVDRMPIFQDLPPEQQSELLAQAQALEAEAVEANAAGRASSKVWPETVFRLDNGGLAFFSQLGRRPTARPDAVFRGGIHPQPRCAGLFRGQSAAVHAGFP